MLASNNSNFAKELRRQIWKVEQRLKTSDLSHLIIVAWTFIIWTKKKKKKKKKIAWTIYSDLVDWFTFYAEPEFQIIYLLIYFFDQLDHLYVELSYYRTDFWLLSVCELAFCIPSLKFQIIVYKIREAISLVLRTIAHIFPFSMATTFIDLCCEGVLYVLYFMKLAWQFSNVDSWSISGWWVLTSGLKRFDGNLMLIEINSCFFDMDTAYPQGTSSTQHM